MRLLFLLLAAAVTPLGAAETVLTVHTGRAAGRVSPTHHGLMTEEINFSYDGGLYAELVRNRAFRDDAKEPVHWTPTGGARLSLDTEHPINPALPVCLRLEAPEPGGGAANDGWWGVPIKPATTYTASLFAMGAPGPLTVALESADGETTYATAETPAVTPAWQAHTVQFTTPGEAPVGAGRLVIRTREAGTVWLGLVSLFPPTWQQRPNGLRPDLMQMLVELRPKFLRFPGGNYLEGDTVETRFKWWETLGPIAERPGHMGVWSYRSSDGMGLREFLLWCEDLQAEPVLGLYAGYSLKGATVKPGPELEPFVQEALEEIEYVMGDAATTKWGARRAQEGHPAPFPLRYVEIGNEDWFDKTNSYDGRFAQFQDAIKAKYPGLRCIASIGFEHPEGKRVQSRRPEVVDEHYYLPAAKFIRQPPDYSRRSREGGPEIFVGEWAAHETSYPPWDKRAKSDPPTPNMAAALGDAAWLAHLERNSDLVTMQCYAPLLVNVNQGQWRPNLIGYDALSAYGSPSYYVVRMFSTNLGEEILAATPAGETPVLSSATRASGAGTVFLKLINPTAEPQALRIELEGVAAVGARAEVETLSAPPEATNSLSDPRRVVPVKTTLEGVQPTFAYTVPPHSLVVLTLHRESERAVAAEDHAP